MPNKVLGSKKYQKGPQKMEKTDYLKNGPSYILPKIKYVISEPHGDLLHWNLSCSLTFNFLVHQEHDQDKMDQKLERITIYQALRKSKKLQTQL